jgi:hypothetical protein
MRCKIGRNRRFGAANGGWAFSALPWRRKLQKNLGQSKKGS